jgi:hypothetical protein
MHASSNCQNGEKKEQKTNNRGITWPDTATIALLNNPWPVNQPYE